MPKEIKNVGASVRARLQHLSRETGQSFELDTYPLRVGTSALPPQHVRLRRPIRSQGRNVVDKLIRGSTPGYS